MLRLARLDAPGIDKDNNFQSHLIQSYVSQIYKGVCTLSLRMLELIKLVKFGVVIFFLSLAMVSYNLAHAQQTNRASIKITVVGLKSDDGNVRVSVYNTEQNWLKESVYKSTVIISNKKCEWILENIPYGDYAVTVFHDENSNGDMDTGFMRIPKEPYGFSNNAKASFGPPKWSDAKFSIISPSVEITVKVE